MKLAPIAIFAYKRPDHLKLTLDSLRRNELASQSKIVIFCDGARRPEDESKVRETKELAKNATWCKELQVVEREKNLGLSSSIMSGVTRLCEEYGRVIVLEDDLEVAPNFLNFMNDALERYQDEENVFQVTGYNYPVRVDLPEDAFFLVHSSCWGWGTWHRAWKKISQDPSLLPTLRSDPNLRDRFDMGGAYPYADLLEKQAKGEVDSWGILWYQTLFREKGLTLMPRRTLVKNIGSDGSGTHGWGIGYADTLSAFQVKTLPARPTHEEKAFRAISDYLKHERYSFSRRLQRKLGSLWNRLSR